MSRESLILLLCFTLVVVGLIGYLMTDKSYNKRLMGVVIDKNDPNDMKGAIVLMVWCFSVLLLVFGLIGLVGFLFIG